MAESPGGGQPLLTLENITKQFGGNIAVNDVTRPSPLTSSTARLKSLITE